MSALLITYDLNAPGQKYDDLYQEIKDLGSTWWHYLDSTWVVKTTLTPDQVELTPRQPQAPELFDGAAR